MAWNSCESARSFRPRRGPRRRTAPDIHAQAGLGAWWNKMLKTKAVAALKGKGKKLMPGEHNKAW